MEATVAENTNKAKAKEENFIAGEVLIDRSRIKLKYKAVLVQYGMNTKPTAVRYELFLVDLGIARNLIDE